jgi:hypothetical protein
VPPILGLIRAGSCLKLRKFSRPLAKNAAPCRAHSAQYIRSATIVLTLGIAISLQKARANSATGTAAAGKPDLIVDQKRLLQNWVVRDEKLPASFCSVEEDGITPGEHTLLRFTVSTPNIGTADVNLGDPNVHVANNDGLLGGQYFVLDGGDGQPPVPPGDYVIRITVNPPFVAALGEPCPNLDPSGFCHQLPELDYTNNISEIAITIPDHPGKQGVGPLKNQPQLTAEPID